MSLLPAAIGIILNNDHTQVLLVKRRDISLWVLPGGGIEPGEIPEEALKREVFEESGFHIKMVRRGAEYHPVNRLSALTFIFVCHISSGSPRLSDETSDLAFFPLNALPKEFFYLHRIWLEEILQADALVCRPLHEVSYFALFIFFLSHPWSVMRYAYTRFFKTHYSCD